MNDRDKILTFPKWEDLEPHIKKLAVFPLTVQTTMPGVPGVFDLNPNNREVKYNGACVGRITEIYQDGNKLMARVTIHDAAVRALITAPPPTCGLKMEDDNKPDER